MLTPYFNTLSLSGGITDFHEVIVLKSILRAFSHRSGFFIGLSFESVSWNSDR